MNFGSWRRCHERSTSFEDKKETTKGCGSSRHEKAERELKRSSLALEKDATEAT
jgi:hypothetical protein